jgi:hypothetical protein
MNLKAQKLAAIGVLLAVLGLAAPQAIAQVACKGKFSLPEEVQWGRFVIPAGNYTFTLDRATPEGILTLRSGNQVLMLWHVGTFPLTSKGKSALHLGRVDGKWRAMHLDLAPVGTTFCYCRTPKESKTAKLAANRDVERTIPVTVQGK